MTFLDRPPARAASRSSCGVCLAARALSIIILEVFAVSVIQIYKVNHCSLTQSPKYACKLSGHHHHLLGVLLLALHPEGG